MGEIAGKAEICDTEGMGLIGPWWDRDGKRRSQPKKLDFAAQRKRLYLDWGL